MENRFFHNLFSSSPLWEGGLRTNNFKLYKLVLLIKGKMYFSCAKWCSLPFRNWRRRWTTTVALSVLITVTGFRQLCQGCATFEGHGSLLDSCHTVGSCHEQLLLLLLVAVAVAVCLFNAVASVEGRFQRFERFGSEENVWVGGAVHWGRRNGVAGVNPGIRKNLNETVCFISQSATRIQHYESNLA